MRGMEFEVSLYLFWKIWLVNQMNKQKEINSSFF